MQLFFSITSFCVEEKLMNLFTIWGVVWALNVWLVTAEIIIQILFKAAFYPKKCTAAKTFIPAGSSSLHIAQGESQKLFSFWHNNLLIMNMNDEHRWAPAACNRSGAQIHISTDRSHCTSKKKKKEKWVLFSSQKLPWSLKQCVTSSWRKQWKVSSHSDTFREHIL